MSIDNQLLIGTLVFAGLGYYVLSHAQPSKEETARTEKEKTAADILAEFDRLKGRMRIFEANDTWKGDNRKITPLSKDDRAGLVEVVTLLRQVEKKQQKTRALDKGTAERFHRDVAALDTKARDYLGRYEHNKDSHKKDPRSVATLASLMGPSSDVLSTRAAFIRGQRSHTRSPSTAPFVADSGGKSGKKRKPNFVQNDRPATVFEAPQPSDNRTQSAGARTAFETNQARDDTHDHATENAEMEEATSSGAHGKNGQHIRPLDSGESNPAQGGNVVFEQAPGPEADNEDSVQRSVSTEGTKRSGEDVLRSRSRSSKAIDLTEVTLSTNALEEMERDLINQMTSLRKGEIRLDRVLDEHLRTIIATLYGDDPTEGNRCIQLLRAYAMRDKDQTSRKHKRPLQSVVIDKGKEKLTIREVSEGSRVILARGSGALGQRAGRFAPASVPRSTQGRSSASRERIYEAQEAAEEALRTGARSRSVSPAQARNR